MERLEARRLAERLQYWTLLHDAGRKDEARSLAESFKGEPQNPRELFQLADALDRIGLPARAVELLPDLITLDVDMPRLDGFTTSRKLTGENYTRRFTHVQGNRIPIIFVTANDTLEGRQKGFERPKASLQPDSEVMGERGKE